MICNIILKQNKPERALSCPVRCKVLFCVAGPAGRFRQNDKKAPLKMGK